MIAAVRLPGREIEQLVGDAVPGDHARQILAEHYIDAAIGRRDGQPWRVLDLGCGSGSSVDFFRARDPSVEWIGLDIPDSPEPRTRTDARFETFDGVSIPFEQASFDLVYCKQVLEHVHHPRPLLDDVRRVLSPGGFMAGSTSQLEPFHSFSTWNYTPYFLHILLQEAGLCVQELRPGIDGPTLIASRMVTRGPLFEHLWGRWWGGQSPLNRVIDLYGRTLRLDTRAVNATKLLFCGQFAFLAQHPSEQTQLAASSAERQIHKDSSTASQGTPATCSA
jgi:SAM-dependent methyltransferase